MLRLQKRTSFWQKRSAGVNSSPQKKEGVLAMGGKKNYSSKGTHYTMVREEEKGRTGRESTEGDSYRVNGKRDNPSSLSKERKLR